MASTFVFLVAVVGFNLHFGHPEVKLSGDDEVESLLLFCPFARR